MKDEPKVPEKPLKPSYEIYTECKGGLKPVLEADAINRRCCVSG